MSAIGPIPALPDVPLRGLEQTQPLDKPGDPFEGALKLDDDAPPKVTFGDVFGEVLGHASGLGHHAHVQGVALAEGRVDDLHGTMIATKKAEISLHLVGTVRDKVLDAFHELWRMNV